MKLVVLGIVCQHFAHFLFGEAYHLVESVGKGIIGADVESTREVVKRHWDHTCDENTLYG